MHETSLFYPDHAHSFRAVNYLSLLATYDAFFGLDSEKWENELRIGRNNKILPPAMTSESMERAAITALTVPPL